VIHSISEFEAGWGDESGSTLKLMRVLTDLSLSTAVAPGFRTLGRLAWHITLTPREMLGRTGLSVEGPDPEARHPLPRGRSPPPTKGRRRASSRR
jgi:uncharacterized damage-inducible protein DinB